ncbi:MAG: Ni/Fe-hydrogenase, b-type cytochrome subunit [Proteobacteria bacterium]|nr:Ni/Fe-hydrogenase, b-type cytochrome subunit [Pseudomonadota bacterium]
MAEGNQWHVTPVYVWQVPVRIFHWVNALALVVLATTGFLIGNPPALLTNQEAYQGYWFGTVRFLHFGSAYLFLFNWVFRIFWSFVGNSYARWNNFMPLTSEQWKEVYQVLKIDILMITDGEIKSVGHNAMASVIYLVLFVCSLFSIFSGFALYAPMSESMIPTLFVGFGNLFESEMSLKYWHHLSMWFYILFLVVHVYLVAFHDYVEARGILSSIVGGWNFIFKNGDT